MSNAAAVESVFFAALERETAAERSAYLYSACGDDSELRRQVERLLKAHPRVGNFLKTPLVAKLALASEEPGATRVSSASTEDPGAAAGGRKGAARARTIGEG